MLGDAIWTKANLVSGMGHAYGWLDLLSEVLVILDEVVDELAHALRVTGDAGRLARERLCRTTTGREIRACLWPETCDPE